MTTSNDNLTIFDTTLRDGEQSPGHSMDAQEKLQIAKKLDAMHVDVIEAGFACSSQEDFQAIHSISQEVVNARITSLARCVESDIRAAAEALTPAKQSRIHVFIATSPIHREFKLKASKEKIIERAIAGVRFARRFAEDVEFSAEDASRTEIEYLIEITKAVIDAGATTINLPDTVGYATPENYAAMISKVYQSIDPDKAIISTHCHDDLGMAVANSLAGVRAGARQVECTINGIGERAGNASLEEIVMAVNTRRDVYQVQTSVDTTRLLSTSRGVANATGSTIPRNKAIVGRNAFAHESGIHQHGMLANRETYEIMKPQDVGFEGSDLVLGKHSGRAALQQRIKTLGMQLEAESVNTVFEAFKVFAESHKAVDDDDIRRIVKRHTEKIDTSTESKVNNVSVTRNSHGIFDATVNVNGKIASAKGSTSYDSIVKAVASATGTAIDECRVDVESTTIAEGFSHRVRVHITQGIRRESISYEGHDCEEAIALATLQILASQDMRASNAKAY